jgi:hypothetical protein
MILTGKTNFSRLPVLNKSIVNIYDLEPQQNISFKNHISIVAFLGDDLLMHKTNALNLNEKVYKRFKEFESFQFVVILPNGTEAKVNQLKKELSYTTDITLWRFVFTSKTNIKTIFDSFKTNLNLNETTAYSKSVFIIDKDASLRGRNDDEDYKDGMLYGFNAESVSEIHQKMLDDIKIITAEYRLALKKNKKETVFKNPYKKTKDTIKDEK